MSDHPKSPCINICVMHPVEGICAGCYRTLDEIAAWGSLSAEAQRAILAKLPARQPRIKKRGDRRGHRAE